MDSNSTRQVRTGIAKARSGGRLASWYAQGKIGWIFLWLLGVPVPILLGLYFLRGCT